ncbi:MAG: hypothetical protein OXF60_00670 [Gammaproteobacteria bacterium]|nr:hypothetical protein [Gammaproteobacteria bacterium]MCY4218728.1 hypothetical protein [Gammaproteobacteria bacterium]
MVTPTNSTSKFFFLILLFLVPVLTWADLPKQHNFPGGISLIQIGDHAQKPRAFFGIDPALVIKEKQKWLAVVGVPMNLVPGRYMLRVEHTEDTTQQSSLQSFTVYPLHSNYKQRSFMLPKKFSPEQFQAYENQQLRSMFGMHSFDSEPLIPNFQFQHVITKGSFLPFGRVLSKNKSQDFMLEDHPMITYLTSDSAIAYSPGNGIVENIVDRGTLDQKIVIRHSDHFRSILSFIANSPLEIGDYVKAGEPIGTTSFIDSLGNERIDWYLMLNGTEIDPLLMIEPISNNG